MLRTKRTHTERERLLYFSRESCRLISMHAIVIRCYLPLILVTLSLVMLYMLLLLPYRRDVTWSSSLKNVNFLIFADVIIFLFLFFFSSVALSVWEYLLIIYRLWFFFYSKNYLTSFFFFYIDWYRIIILKAKA